MHKLTTRYNVHDTLRIPDYGENKNYPYRLYRVKAHKLGAEGFEDYYELEHLDRKIDGETIRIPAIILETHPAIEII